MLRSDNQMIIIVRVEAEGVLLEKDDINPHFPSRISREAMGYYSYRKHMPYVFPQRRSRVTSVGETSSNGVCVICYGFVGHLH